MKQTILTLLLALGFSFQANAIPSYPRDLQCDLPSGEPVTLASNNGFWSFAENGRYNVELLVGSEVMTVSWVNNKAKATRGNDKGLRKYMFTSSAGENFFVELEFFAPFGTATGIKSFSVLSSSVKFQHSQSSLGGGLCNVKFYSKIDI